MPTALPADVQAALAQGDKLEAIRRLREVSSLSLSAAKDAVERGELPDGPLRTASPAAPVAVARDLPALPGRARTALQSGQVIEAIKLTRLDTGLGLRDSKAVVEAALAADPLLQARAREAAAAQAGRWRSALVWGGVVIAVLVIAAYLDGWL